MRGPRTAAAAVIGAALLAGGAWMLGWRGRVVPSAPTAEQRPASTAGRARVLENSLRALADAGRDLPRDRWDPAWVVSRVGRDPDSLRQWVQTRTSWVPYRGTLRGPVGVLMDRRGNGLDRALLLADLLARAGHTARVAHAELTRAQAEALLAPVLTAGAAAAADAAPAPDPAPLPAVALEYGVDARAVERTLSAQLEATARLLDSLEARAGDQSARLLDAVPGPSAAAEWSVRRDSTVAALRDHWWPQVRDGGGWRDLDLVPRDSAGLTDLTPLAATTPDQLDASLRHEVVVRVVAERLTGGALHETPALEYALRPADVIDRAVVLQFWPTTWAPDPASPPSESGRSLRRAALEQEEWSASLLVGKQEVAHALLGASAEGPPPSGIGGLGGAMAGALRRGENRDATADGVLTAVWIEYVLRVPGRASRIERRSIFDLVGPADRLTGRIERVRAPGDSLRLVRGFGLMMRTEILPLAASPAAEFVVHRFASDLTANRALLLAVAEPGFGRERQRTDSLLRGALPGVGPLHTFAVLRQEALGDVAFLDRPAIFTRHQYPVVRGAGAALADAIDLVANELGISLAEGDGFAARLAQGVWDTNLEALLGGRGGGNAAQAFASGGDWSLLEAQGDIGNSRLSDDARVLLARDLRDGAVVVAPDATAGAVGGADAWWRIDPATGAAVGIGSTGWGQAVDYGTHLAVLAEMAQPFVFAYSLCQFIPQAANSLNILGTEFWELGLTPSWVTRPPDSRGKDFEDVAAENHRTCLIDAIQGGFLATAPILLMAIRAEMKAARYARLASRARGGPWRAGRRPASGWRGRPYTGRRGPRVGRGGRGGPPAPPTAPPALPEGKGRYDPRPADGRVPPGKGPFQGDPANRDWHRQNWDPDPLKAHPGTRALGGPQIYDNADRAAVERYKAARGQGLDDQAARAESFKEWWSSVQNQRRANGVYQFPGMFPAEPGGAAWQEWVPEAPIGGGSPPPGTSGSSPMGTSVGGSAPSTGGSPMASSSPGPAPAPAPDPVPSPLSDSRMAVGFGGLTGPD